jgi:predicted solute-binding protein
VVARKCGIVGEDEELDKMTLRHYLNSYKSPLSEEEMEAIKNLSKITEEKKIKKKGKKKKKASCKGKSTMLDGKKKSSKVVEAADGVA